MQYSVKEATIILNFAILCTTETRQLVSILEGRTSMMAPGADPLSLTEVYMMGLTRTPLQRWGGLIGKKKPKHW